MPTPEQLKLAFGAFPLPLVLATILFLGAWLGVRKRERYFESASRTGHLDIWALAIAFTVGHHTVSGLTGFPPSDSIDWLPIGLIGMALVASLPLPRPAVATIIVTLSMGALGLTLNGFESYRDSHPLSERLLVFAALALALIAGTASLGAIARRLSLADFFLLTGIAGAVGAGTLLTGFNTVKFAQMLGVALAIGGVGFIVGIATKTRHVSPAYAAGWSLIWVTLASNAYFGNYELPASAPLALLLAMPVLAGVGIWSFDTETHPWRARLAIYGLSLAAVLIALGLAMPPAEDDETDADNPYAEWG